MRSELRDAFLEIFGKIDKTLPYSSTPRIPNTPPNNGGYSFDQWDATINELIGELSISKTQEYLKWMKIYQFGNCGERCQLFLELYRQQKKLPQYDVSFICLKGIGSPGDADYISGHTFIILHDSILRTKPFTPSQNKHDKRSIEVLNGLIIIDPHLKKIGGFSQLSPLWQQMKYRLDGDCVYQWQYHPKPIASGSVKSLQTGSVCKVSPKPPYGKDEVIALNLKNKPDCKTGIFKGIIRDGRNAGRYKVCIEVSEPEKRLQNIAVKPEACSKLGDVATATVASEEEPAPSDSEVINNTRTAP